MSEKKVRCAPSTILRKIFVARNGAPCLKFACQEEFRLVTPVTTNSHLAPAVPAGSRGGMSPVRCRCPDQRLWQLLRTTAMGQPFALHLTPPPGLKSELSFQKLSCLIAACQSVKALSVSCSAQRSCWLLLPSVSSITSSILRRTASPPSRIFRISNPPASPLNRRPANPRLLRCRMRRLQPARARLSKDCVFTSILPLGAWDRLRLRHCLRLPPSRPIIPSAPRGRG
jgi:hypothetical protein